MGKGRGWKTISGQAARGKIPSGRPPGELSNPIKKTKPTFK